MLCLQTNELHRLLVICDRCNKEYHPCCLPTELQLIPEGKWYCPECSAVCHVCCKSLRPSITSATKCICRTCHREYHEKCIEHSNYKCCNRPPSEEIPEITAEYEQHGRDGTTEEEGITSTLTQPSLLGLPDELLNMLRESKDSYSGVDKLDNAQKIRCNAYFFLEVAKTMTEYNGSKGPLLLLDALTFYSSRLANMFGFEPHEILVPNNGGDAQEMLQFNGLFCNTIKSSALEFLVREPTSRVPFLGVFLDYCGTVSLYKRDIEILFIKKMLMAKSVLAITFNVREKGGREVQTQTAHKAVREYSKKYGYTAKLIDSYTYGLMFFVCYRMESGGTGGEHAELQSLMQMDFIEKESESLAEKKREGDDMDNASTSVDQTTIPSCAAPSRVGESPEINRRHQPRSPASPSSNMGHNKEKSEFVGKKRKRHSASLSSHIGRNRQGQFTPFQIKHINTAIYTDITGNWEYIWKSIKERKIFTKREAKRNRQDVIRYWKKIIAEKKDMVKSLEKHFEQYKYVVADIIKAKGKVCNLENLKIYWQHSKLDEEFPSKLKKVMKLTNRSSVIYSDLIFVYVAHIIG